MCKTVFYLLELQSETKVDSGDNVIIVKWNFC